MGPGTAGPRWGRERQGHHGCASRDGAQSNGVETISHGDTERPPIIATGGAVATGGEVAPGAGHAETLEGLTILIVDDEPSVALVAQRALERRGAVVVLATDGTEALTAHAAQAGPVDVALIDMRLPHLGGIQVAEELRRRDPQIQIILSSGLSPADPARLAALGPGVTFLVKPYPLRDLYAALAAARRPAGPSG